MKRLVVFIVVMGLAANAGVVNAAQSAPRRHRGWYCNPRNVCAALAVGAAALFAKNYFSAVPESQEPESAVPESQEPEIANPDTELPPDMPFSLLHFAAAKGDLEEVHALLDAGADVNDVGLFDATPLNTGVCVPQNGPCQAALVHMLADHGAHVDAVDIFENTALSCAIKNNEFACTKALLAHGANPNYRYKSMPLLHWAVLSSFTENIEIIKALLDAGANPNAHDEVFQTPLHHAALKGLKAATTELIAAGANVNLLDMWDRTPLDNALNKQHHELAELLIRHGGRRGSEL